jgi:ABC-type glutathione transport system ATPase component
LALALSRRPTWLVADEFTATLDRTLARVIAFNIRRLADRMGVGFLLATTHEDVAEDLSPDVHVCCRLDGAIEVRSPASLNEGPAEQVTPECEQGAKPGFLKATSKKKESPSPAISGSATRPVATGRISLGGITAAIRSP